jgi:hypothetical protein
VTLLVGWGTGWGDDKRWDRFGDLVGWKQGGRWENLGNTEAAYRTPETHDYYLPKLMYWGKRVVILEGEWGGVSSVSSLAWRLKGL